MALSQRWACRTGQLPGERITGPVITIVERPRGGSKGVAAVARMCRSFWVAVRLFRTETLGITPSVLGACASNVVQFGFGPESPTAYTPWT